MKILNKTLPSTKPWGTRLATELFAREETIGPTKISNICYINLKKKKRPQVLHFWVFPLLIERDNN